MKKSIIAGMICIYMAGIVSGAGFIKEKNSTPMEQYVVRMEGRSVNVYEVRANGEVFRNSVTEVDTFDIPDSTATKLKEGIKIDSLSGVERLIEEITS
ncbi:MAG: hypothetical protein IJC89_03945 [Clostridia bacterium]|nr:hypothetical protein [Clostridia bacterium]